LFSSFVFARFLNNAAMSNNLGIWDKLTKMVLALLLVAIVICVSLAVVIWYVPLIQHNERMRKEILRLNDQIKIEERKAALMKMEIDALRTDPKAVERLAREKLGYAKPGETVIRFQDPPTNSVAAKP
jgi:cell division protein FtsB